MKKLTKKIIDDQEVKTAWKDALKLVLKKGNIWALAVGVLIGSTFGAVINSLANDIIMNAIAKAGGIKGVEALAVGATKWDANGIPVDGIKYGKFLSVLFSFVIISFFLVASTAISIFVWRRITRKKHAAEKASPAPVVVPTTDELILAELIKLNAANEAKVRKK